jgi:hypothetical protein
MLRMPAAAARQNAQFVPPTLDDVSAPARVGQRESTAGERRGGIMPTATELGQTGLQGWREKVADGISQPVASRAPLDEDQVRAIVGAAFFVLAVTYVIKTIAEASRRARAG